MMGRCGDGFENVIKPRLEAVDFWKPNGNVRYCFKPGLRI